VGDVLRLLGAGATGPILMALGPRPLRTKALTERVPRYTPRTVYRYAAKLSELELVERRETEGVPSTVIYSLSGRSGRDLYRLLEAYASAARTRDSEGQIDDGLWTTLRLLGELWDSGWVEQLSCEERSPTELAEITAELTFHQANRRAHLVCSRGLLCQLNGQGRGVRYQLTDQARQGMVLIAGLGRWRLRHWRQAKGESALTVKEMATILRGSLPLVRLPGNPETTIRLGVVGATDGNGGTGAETLLGRTGRDGKIRCREDEGGSSDAWVLATVGTWLSALLEGNRGRMRVGGDLPLVDTCLTQLHLALWGKA
jgi:DNA-binding HxlR family transcriptional regulator